MPAPRLYDVKRDLIRDATQEDFDQRDCWAAAYSMLRDGIPAILEEVALVAEGKARPFDIRPLLKGAREPIA